MSEPEETATEASETAESNGGGSLKGFKLDEMGGVQVGRIEGSRAGTNADIEWLVARMGRFGHYCLVPGRDAVPANGRIWVPYTRDQIRRAPRVDPKAPLDGELEQAILAHYGLS